MNTTYFYKGTCFPLCIKNITIKDVLKNSKDMLKMGLITNVSLEEQAQDYFKQLDIIENALFKYCNPSSKKGLKKVCNILNKSDIELFTLWSLNICALLHLKKLNDDDLNGYYTDIL